MDTSGHIEPVPQTLRRASINHDGRKGSFIPKDQWARYALGWSIAQLIISVAIEIYIALKHRQHVSDVSAAIDPNTNGLSVVIKNGEAITIYHALFIAAQFFQLVLLWDALYQLSLIQLVTTTIFNWASWFYALVQYSQAANWLTPSGSTSYQDLLPSSIQSHPTNMAEIVLIVIFLAFCLGWVYLTYKLYFVFGWTTYKQMGADVQFRNVLYLYHIYILLLKVDAFFFLGFDLQFLFLILIPGSNGGSNSETDVIVHALISFPGSVLALVLAYYAVRKENRYMVYATLALCIGLIGYLSSKLYDIWGARQSRFQSSRNSLTFFIALTIIMTVLTMIALIANMLRFGEGLIQRLESQSTVNQDDTEMDDYIFGPGSRPQYDHRGYAQQATMDKVGPSTLSGYHNIPAGMPNYTHSYSHSHSHQSQSESQSQLQLKPQGPQALQGVGVGQPYQDHGMARRQAQVVSHGPEARYNSNQYNNQS